MLLPVQVTFRNVMTTPKLEKLVHSEAAKLERFYDRISSCRVIVERPQRATSSKLYHVRIDLGLPQGELVVKHAPTLHGTLKDTETERSRKEAESVLVHKTPERAIREAFAEMKRQLQDYRRRQEGAVKSPEHADEGIVAALVPDEGYGFLETADGRQVYFNQASVLDGHFDRLRAGSKVRFVQEMGEKGPQASTVKLVHARKQGRTAAGAKPMPRKLAIVARGKRRIAPAKS